MPSNFRLTPRAINDLEAIWNFIGEDNPDAADDVLSAIFDSCESLMRHPLLGAKRAEVTSLPVRFWAVTRFSNYIVVYRPDAKPLQVVAVLHGRRDIRVILQELHM
jgi:plasmid stabilization system protein ParE